MVADTIPAAPMEGKSLNEKNMFIGVMTRPIISTCLPIFKQEFNRIPINDERQDKNEEMATAIYSVLEPTSI